MQNWDHERRLTRMGQAWQAASWPTPRPRKRLASINGNSGREEREEILSISTNEAFSACHVYRHGRVAIQETGGPLPHMFLPRGIIISNAMLTNNRPPNSVPCGPRLYNRSRLTPRYAHADMRSPQTTPGKRPPLCRYAMLQSHHPLCPLSPDADSTNPKSGSKTSQVPRGVLTATLSATNDRSIKAHVIPAVSAVDGRRDARVPVLSPQRSRDWIAGRQRGDPHPNRESSFPRPDQETRVERLAERSGTVDAGEYARSGTPSSNS
jgi:hypothetical protein